MKNYWMELLRDIITSRYAVNESINQLQVLQEAAHQAGDLRAL